MCRLSLRTVLTVIIVCEFLFCFWQTMLLSHRAIGGDDVRTAMCRNAYYYAYRMASIGSPPGLFVGMQLKSNPSSISMAYRASRMHYRFLQSCANSVISAPADALHTICGQSMITGCVDVVLQTNCLRPLANNSRCLLPRCPWGSVDPNFSAARVRRRVEAPRGATSGRHCRGTRAIQ